MRNRRELRGGVPLDKECARANTIRDNGDNICCGLHNEPESFMLAEYADRIEAAHARECEAQRIYNESGAAE